MPGQSLNDEPSRKIQDSHRADDGGFPQPSYQVLPPTRYSTNSLNAILSTKTREGAWIVPANLSATSVMGTIKLDFCESVFESLDLTIDLNGFLGDVKIWAPEGTLVIDETRAFASEVKLKKLSPPRPGGLRITLRGDLILGTVIVYGSDHISWRRRRKRRN